MYAIAPLKLVKGGEPDGDGIVVENLYVFGTHQQPRTIESFSYAYIRVFFYFLRILVILIFHSIMVSSFLRVSISMSQRVGVKKANHLTNDKVNRQYCYETQKENNVFKWPLN